MTLRKRRPFTGAWIETQGEYRIGAHYACRPFTGAWIETPIPCKVLASFAVAPSRGRGLKPTRVP